MSFFSCKATLAVVFTCKRDPFTRGSLGWANLGEVPLGVPVRPRLWGFGFSTVLDIWEQLHQAPRGMSETVVLMTVGVLWLLFLYLHSARPTALCIFKIKLTFPDVGIPDLRRCLLLGVMDLLANTSLMSEKSVSTCWTLTSEPSIELKLKFEFPMTGFMEDGCACVPAGVD